MIDPYTVSGFQTRLSEPLRDENIGPSVPWDLISQVWKERRPTGRRASRLIDLPVSVTITKSDILRYALGIDATEYAVLNEGAYPVGGYGSHEASERVSEVKELLTKIGAQAALQAENQFTPCGFHAISVMGSPVLPDGQLPVLQPVRHLEPFLWLLEQLGVISTQRPSVLSGNHRPGQA